MTRSAMKLPDGLRICGDSPVCCGGINYDCTPPKNPDGSERSFDNKKHDLASSKYKELQIQRKKNKN